MYRHCATKNEFKKSTLNNFKYLALSILKKLVLYLPVKNSIAHMTITIFLLFCFPDGCSQWLHPRKHVVCYFEGKRSVTSLNACLCTHLIYTNVGLNPEAKLDITNGKSSKVFNYGQKSPISVQKKVLMLDIKSFVFLQKIPLFKENCFI